MKKLLLTAVLLSQVALGADSNVVDLESLAAQADAAAKGMHPQLIFGQEQAKLLAQAVAADVKDNNGSAVAQLLRQLPYESPSWQVIAKTIVSHPHGGAPPTYEGRATLENIFTATIKTGDHPLKYTPPRGWDYPYGLRRRLASWISNNPAGDAAIVDEKLLREDPAAWLVKHGVGRNGASSAFPDSGRKTVQPLVEVPPAAAASSSAPVVSPPTAPATTSQTPSLVAAQSPSDAIISRGLPGYALCLAAGAVVLAVLAWVTLKKKRAV